MDSSLYRDINRFAVHTSWLHPVGKFFAVYAIGLFGLIVVAAWYLARRQPDAPRAVAAAIWAAVGTLVAVAINQPIVHAVGRARPYAVMPHVEVLVSRGTDFSFPSDHAVTAGAATAGIWIVAHYGGRVLRSLAIGATVLALLVAFARVYVGAHYPGDVVAGLLIGAAISVVGWLALSRLLTGLTTTLRDRTPLRPLVSAGGRQA